MIDAHEVVALLGLEPHLEGGWYRETWRSAPYGEGRSAGTAAYYLLEAGQHAAWRRVDADETWHFYAGDPLELSVRVDDLVSPMVLGNDLASGHVPQFVVPVGVWQTARPLGRWTLCGCTVSPGFSFDGVELDSDPA